MARLWLFLAFFTAVVASAAGTPKKAPTLFSVAPSNECAQLGCDVRPADGVRAERGVTSVFEPARRSCCSGQGGVCGCASGQSVCCDGKLNSACGCD